MATQQSEALRQANTDWLQPYHFDVGICLHLPNAYRALHGASERTFQHKLRRFFTRLDRKVLKSACRKRHEKIPRYVVLEQSPALGWHVHALLSSETSAFSPERLCMIVKLMWLEEFGETSLKGFEPHMGWAEPIVAGYSHYLSEDLYGPHATAVFDEMNSAFG